MRVSEYICLDLRFSHPVETMNSVFFFNNVDLQHRKNHHEIASSAA